MADLPHNLSSLADGFFYGFIISVLLLGITIMQGWTYFHHNSDHWAIRFFVAYLIALDIAESCCSTQLLHHYLIANFGNFEVLRKFSSVISVDFGITGAIFFTVHLYFARRLHLVSRSRWLPGLIVILTLAMLVVGICTIPYQENITLLSSLNITKTKILLIVFHALALFIDVLITLGLTFTLSRAKTQVKSTQSMLQRLLIYFASRGILVTLAQIGHIIMYLVDPSNYMFWVSLHLNLSKLYVISTLVTCESIILYLEGRFSELICKRLNSRPSFKNNEVVLESLHFAPTETGMGNSERQVSTSRGLILHSLSIKAAG